MDDKLHSQFADMEVLSVTQVKNGNFLRVRLRDGIPMDGPTLRKVENMISDQVLRGLMSVRIEYENGYEYAEVGSGAYADPEENRRVAQPASTPAKKKMLPGPEEDILPKAKKRIPACYTENRLKVR